MRSYDSPSPVILTLYSFKDEKIKRIIHAIKYFHRKDLIAPLVTPVTQELRSKNLTNFILVPIPMPQLRKYMRGYNHSEAIAHELSIQTLLPVNTTLLQRNSSIKRQVLTRSRKERLKNQHNAFTVKENVHGMNILLVDDVTTTGATLLEARKKLIEKGAARVEALALAH